MYVERIEIPAFRVLRNVVLDFGGGYDPQIFPIGSENGGGKSTLLQLVFALLHCSAEPSRHEYLKNLLESDFYTGNDDERLLARLTVRASGESYALEFIALHDRFLEQKLEEAPQVGFESWASLVPVLESIRTAEAQFEHDRDGPRAIRIQRKYDFTQAQLRKSAFKEAEIADARRISALMVALNYEPITTYGCPTPRGQQTRALVCRVHDQSPSATKARLALAARSVFLLGPSNQQYLFLNRDARKALLSTTPPRAEMDTEDEPLPPRPQIQYLNRLDEAESAMPGFFAYDWLSVEPLVQLFASARDEDFKSAVKTGTYGNRYVTILKDVNALLLGKHVRPLEDLSGVELIVTNPRGEETKISPEDLSQGELKRLMIYAWLKANEAVDSLVLIDEIEASLHPDWQLGIVHDLQRWAPNNQYLLATHSYDLCRALTPRHVRDLSPALPWKAGEPSDG